MQLVRNNPNYAMLHAHIIPRPASAMNESVAKAAQGMYQLEMIPFFAAALPNSRESFKSQRSGWSKFELGCAPEAEQGVGSRIGGVLCRVSF